MIELPSITPANYKNLIQGQGQDRFTMNLLVQTIRNSNLRYLVELVHFTEDQLYWVELDGVFGTIYSHNSWDITYNISSIDRTEVTQRQLGCTTSFDVCVGELNDTTFSYINDPIYDSRRTNLVIDIASTKPRPYISQYSLYRPGRELVFYGLYDIRTVCDSGVYMRFDFYKICTNADFMNYLKDLCMKIATLKVLS